MCMSMLLRARRSGVVPRAAAEDRLLDMTSEHGVGSVRQMHVIRCKYVMIEQLFLGSILLNNGLCVVNLPICLEELRHVRVDPGVPCDRTMRPSESRWAWRRAPKQPRAVSMPQAGARSRDSTPKLRRKTIGPPKASAKDEVCLARVRQPMHKFMDALVPLPAIHSSMPRIARQRRGLHCLERL